MNINELKSRIALIQDEKKVTFSIGDEILSNHFESDKENKMTEEDTSTLLAMTIYSWISNSIIFKAQGRESYQKGYSYFKDAWDKIIKNQKEELKAQGKTEEENALFLLDEFFSNSRQVLLSEMIAKFAPLAVLSLISEKEEESLEIIKTFQKEKEIIFNQVVLFSRSLFHCFLNRNDMESDKIRPDYFSLGNGVFLYKDNTIVVSTWQNAFTLDAYKEVLYKGLNSLSSNFPTANIESVSVIYLVKDIFAICKL